MLNLDRIKEFFGLKLKNSFPEKQEIKRSEYKRFFLREPAIGMNFIWVLEKEFIEILFDVNTVKHEYYTVVSMTSDLIILELVKPKQNS